MSGALRARPAPDPARCVRSHLRGASCAACALGCPRGALMPTPDGVALDPDACSGCGQCQAVCPTEALGPPAHPPARGEILDLRCSAAGAGNIGCIHALGPEALARLWLEGARKIRITTADCAACADAPDCSLAQHVETLNALLAARDLPPFALRRARPDPSDGPADPGRRGFLRRFAASASDPTPQDPALARLQRRASGPCLSAPRIDPARCTACNGCVRICPEGALMLIKDRNGVLGYHIDSTRCTACALCIDLCDHKAIELSPMDLAGPDIPLQSDRCQSCGVQTLRIAQPGQGAPDRCPTCQRAPHAAALYQVLE